MDLQSIEAKLKKQLAALDRKQAAIEEKLKALEIVKRAAEEVGDWDVPAEEEGEGEAGAGDAKTDLSAVDEEPLAAQEVAEAEKAEEIEEPEVEEVAEAIEEVRQEPTPIEDMDMVALTEEEAILEVIRTFNEPLKGPRIAEELIAVGYPFDDSNPNRQVEKTLEKMQKEGRIKRMKTIKGTFFGLPDA